MALDRINATALLDGGVTSADLATQTGNVDFADNAQIRLGDSQDLQLLHDGFNSKIVDAGTGDLLIAADNNITFTNSAITENKAIFTTNGGATLYYDNTQKFSTSATGVDVTGAISSNKGSAGTLATFTDGVNSNFVVETSSLLTTIGNGAGSTALALKANNTEAMRIDNSGHVGIAENSSIDGRLHINSTGQNNASGINILLECTSGGGRQWAHRISETGVNNGWYVIRDQTADKTRIQIHENAYFMINPINEQTHVRIGTTGAIGTGYAGFELVRTSDNIGVMNIGKTYSGNTSAVKFWYSASQVGSITYSNSATAYNTSSDYRLKENVEYDFDATTRLKQLKPARFNFIEDADTTVDGFLAHEVQDIVPEAITGIKDGMRDEEYEVTPAVEATYDDDGTILTEAVPAVMATRSVPDYQGIDQGKLVPLLVKSLQEALTKIDEQSLKIGELETRIASLEAN